MWPRIQPAINAQTDGNLSLFKEGKLAMVGNFWGPWFQETLDATPGLGVGSCTVAERPGRA